MLQNKKGVSLIIVVFAMLLFAILGWSLTILQSGDFEATSRQADAERAFYLAEAGINHGMRQLGLDNSWRTGGTYTLSPGEYTISFADGVGGQVVITSTGYVPSTTNYRAMRRIQITVEMAPWDAAIDGINLFDWSEMDGTSRIKGNVNAAYYDGDGDSTYNEVGQDYRQTPNALPLPVSPYERNIQAVTIPPINMKYFEDKAKGVNHYINAPYVYVADYATSGTSELEILNNIPSGPTYTGSATPDFNRANDVHGYFKSGSSWYTCVVTASDGPPRFRTVNVTNPANPTVSGTVTITDGRGVFTDVGEAYEADYAYVADGSSGLQVIDISNPGSASIAATCDTSGTAYGVYVRGTYAYVADGSSGLQIINISNPTSPGAPVNYNTPGDSRGVYVRGRYAFVADGTDGTKGMLQIINISNPASPTLRATVNLPNGSFAYDVYVKGRYAYVAAGTAGLQVIDISELANAHFTPTIVGTYDTATVGDEARSVHISGDPVSEPPHSYAYIAYGSTGLQVVDVSTPASPSGAGNYDTNDARGVFVLGDKVFDANHNNEKVWYTVGNIIVKGGNYQHTTFVAEGDIELIGTGNVAFKAHVVPSAHENFPNLATVYGSIVATDPANRSFDGLVYSQTALLDFNGITTEGVLMSYNIFLDGDCDVEYDSKYVGSPPDGFASGVTVSIWNET